MTVNRNTIIIVAIIAIVLITAMATGTLTEFSVSDILEPFGWGK